MGAAVVLISVGKPDHGEKVVTPEMRANEDEYLMYSIIFALITGLILTINAVVMRHYVKYIHISPL